MKREIKFRAYGKINCFYLTKDGWKPEYKMCEVSSLNIKTNKCRVLYKGENNSNEYDTFKLSEVNLMQYTGLKDKNGKEIYEGDIVRWDDMSNGKKWRVAIVELFPALQFRIIKIDCNFIQSAQEGKIFKFGNFIYTDTHNHLYIIGNIHENTELL